MSFTLFHNLFQLEYYVIAIFTLLFSCLALQHDVVDVFFFTVCFFFSSFSSFSFIIRPQNVNANNNTHHFITYMYYLPPLDLCLFVFSFLLVFFVVFLLCFVSVNRANLRQTFTVHVNNVSNNFDTLRSKWNMNATAATRNGVWNLKNSPHSTENENPAKQWQIEAMLCLAVKVRRLFDFSE